MLYSKLKSKMSFINLRKKGSSYVAPAFVILVIKAENSSEKLKVGFTSSKKIGNAVERNRARRRLKAAFSKVPAETIDSFDGYEFNIIARYKARTADFTKIETYFKKTLDKIKKDERKL